MMIIDTIIAMCRKITELGIALLAVAVVLQIVFGTAVPFIGVDAIGNGSTIRTKSSRRCRTGIRVQATQA